MAASWLLQAIYTSLLGQAIVSPDKAPTDSTATFVTTTTPYGDLKGVRQMTATNAMVDSYLGIPYALPPVGQRRFSRPQKSGSWNGVKDASKFKDECFQRTMSNYILSVGEKQINQSEDCLYLNVYIPTNARKDQSLAVMVWIHGGGFVFGAGSQYDGSELATTGVIVVTINYRLDIFGFLSNEDDIIPGNFGMLDQIMALTWVKQSISSFGGDPNKVTIFGESAGSASVSLLVLSPLAKGLFQRAIMESGVSISPWAVTSPAKKLSPRTVLSLIGDRVGCTVYEASKKLQCFRNIDAESLANASSSVENIFPSGLLFSPRVETAFSFLPDFPINLMSQNKFNHVDTIRGFNADESGAAVIDDENDGISKEESLQSLRVPLEPYAFTDKDLFINELFSTYNGNQTNRFAIRYATVRAESDINFNSPTFIEANLQSERDINNKHYMYEFVHKPSFSTIPTWVNATHGEEVPFVFGVNLAEFKRFYGKTASKDDNMVWNQMKTLWSNFAKFGNPTQTIPTGAVSWTPYNAKNGKYLRIDTQSQMETFTNTERITLYSKLIQKLRSVSQVSSVVG